MMRLMNGNFGKECSFLWENVGGWVLLWVVFEKVGLRRYVGKYRVVFSLVFLESIRKSFFGLY